MYARTVLVVDFHHSDIRSDITTLEQAADERTGHVAATYKTDFHLFTP
jgi:hypothetical protein